MFFDRDKYATLTNDFNLIQRCLERKYHSEDKKGVDKILSFDYMGSAEFEWGTLPNTVRILRELGTQKKLTLTKATALVTYRNTPFWCIVPTDWDIVEFNAVLGLIARQKLRTKESTHLDAWAKKVLADYSMSKASQDHLTWKRENTTAWLVCVEKRKEFRHPAFWCVNEGTARKMFAELCGTKI
jgi:hypothetical protein